MNFFISAYNDFITAIFITFVFYFLNYINNTEYSNYFVLLFISIIAPIIIFSQAYSNPYMNLRSLSAILFYGSIILLLLLVSIGLNMIHFKNKSMELGYMHYYKYIAIFLLSGAILRYFYIGNIDIGIIHSLTGATNAQPLVDMLKFQIFKVNANGGINGRKINAHIVDGKSDPQVYKQEVQTFINKGIKTIFGAWTSADRKAIIPIIEKNNALLFYPIQYEGQECSKNVIYTGSVPNQQLEVGSRWALHNLGAQFYLIGTDSVYPKTANKILRAVIEKNSGKVLGEEYFPYGSTDYKGVIHKIMQNPSCIILNTINGTDANKALFENLYNAYKNKNKGKVFVPVSEVYPIVSFSITEHTFMQMKPEYVIGHYAVWSYFQSLKNKTNEEFVKEYKEFYLSKIKNGDDVHNIIVNDPMVSSYTGFSLWARAVSELDNHKNLDFIKEHMIENPYQAPEGEVVLNNNNHLSKYVRIGMGNKNKLFDIVYNTLGPVDPIVWNEYLTGSNGMKCDHGQYLYGSSFKHGPLSLETNLDKQVGTTEHQPTRKDFHNF
jgi:urea transport system substrate-binding protein